jgi:CHASE2 domain-containing sensor protein
MKVEGGAEKKAQPSVAWFLLIVFLAGFFLARESHRAGPVAGVDRSFFDWLVVNTHVPPPSSTEGNGMVTLVEIDDSIAQTPGRLPLPPIEYASFLQAVGKYDPAVVAIEPILSWPQLPPGTEDILFQQALALPKLLLSVQLGSAENRSLDAANLPALDHVKGNAGSLPEFFDIVAGPNPRLLTLASGSGAVNLPGIEGEPLRDLPLIFRIRDRVLPSFTLETLRLWLRLAPSEMSVTLGDHIDLGDRLRLPINAAGRTLLDARAYPGIRRISFDDLPLLLTGTAGPETKATAEGMRGGIVILGRTDQASRTVKLLDGSMISPAEVFAWAAASLDHAPSTRRASPWWDAVLTCCFALLGLRLLGKPRFSAVCLMGVAVAAYGGLALSLFDLQRLWLPLALPLALAGIIVVLFWATPLRKE